MDRRGSAGPEAQAQLLALAGQVIE